jgi:hypothetical protein
MQRAGTRRRMLDDRQPKFGGAAFNGLDEARRHVMGVNVGWHEMTRWIADFD